MSQIMPGDQSSNDSGIVMPRKRRSDDIEMDITPMIDITFLLLIYFLVAAKIEEQASVELPPAQHGEDVSSKNSIILTIVKGDDFAKVYRGNAAGNESIFKGSTMEEQEEQIRLYVAQGIAGDKPFTSPQNKIFIKAEKGLKQREVARVIKALSTTPEGDPLPDEVKIHWAVLENQ